MQLPALSVWQIVSATGRLVKSPVLGATVTVAPAPISIDATTKAPVPASLPVETTPLPLGVKANATMSGGAESAMLRSSVSRPLMMGAAVNPVQSKVSGTSTACRATLEVKVSRKLCDALLAIETGVLGVPTG